MDNITTKINESDLLLILQLASPSLPVGAYSYSEGLEYLIDRSRILDQQDLGCWLQNELKYGSIRLETAVMLRARGGMIDQNFKVLNDWNCWLSATRETEELRQQSWQMGQSLLKLLLDLNPNLKYLKEEISSPCNYAIAFGIAAGFWNFSPSAGVISYLYSWLTNLITAGVKLIPLGQTAGQQLLLSFHSLLIEVAREILALPDEELFCCSWGLALASMGHRTQYTRLFRS